MSAPPQTSTPSAESTRWWSIESDSHPLVTAWIHLAVLWSFAVAKPLFDVLSNDPAFFVARGNTSADIIIFSIGLVLVPPTVLIAVEALFIKFARVRLVIHVLFVAGLVAAFVLQLLADSVSGVAALLALAAIVGLLAAAAYARFPAVRSTLTVLGPLPALFLVLFLFTGQVSDLVLPSGEDSAAATEVEGDTPVVMVVFDELAAASLMNDRGRVDPSRYPNFARLAGASTWYRDATTAADVTAQAVPTILTGQKATSKTTLPTLAAHPNNLFTLLGESYDLDVYEAATRMCPADLCESRDESSTADRISSLIDDLSLVSAHQLAPESIDRRLPAVDQTFAGFGDDAGGGGGGASAGVPNQAFVNREGVFNQFLDGLGDDGRRPALHFIHTELPHVPWEYLPSGQSYPVTGPETPGIAGDPSAEWTKNEAVVLGNQHRYLLQLGFVDNLIGELMDRLDETGLWDRSLVVITADHGVSFQAGKNRRYIDRSNFGDIAGVPLFIKAPGQRRGRVDTAPVQSLDILPTIARYLGVTPPWKLDGEPIQERAGQAPQELRVFGYDSGWVAAPLDEFRRSRDAAARQTAALTAASSDGTPLYSLTAAEQVEGRLVSDLPEAAPIDAEVSFESPGLFNSVRPAGEVVPSYVTGVLSGSVEDGQALAIAVNGRVQTVAQAFDDHGDLRFGGIVPPSAFRDGRNSVRVFAVEQDGGEVRLASLGVGGGAKLVDDQTLVLSSGRKVPVGSGAIEGAIDRLTYRDTQLEILGWAADGERDRGADQILVFAGDKLLVAGRPTVARPDIADRFGERAITSGYELQVYSPQAESLADPSKIRVFAVSGSDAGELKASGGATVGEAP